MVKYVLLNNNSNKSLTRREHEKEQPAASTSSSSPQHVTDPVVDDNVFSPSGIEELINRLRNNSAPRSDGIPVKFLKIAKRHMTILLGRLYQSSFDSSYIPYDWKFPNVISAFKYGEKNLPSNYRPISLTSISRMIIPEHVIYSHLINLLYYSNLMYRNLWFP